MPQICTGKPTGARLQEKNCGSPRIRARGWRFDLARLHAASGPRAGRTQARNRSLSSKLQREDQLGGCLSGDEPREGVSIRSASSARSVHQGSGSFRPFEESRLASAESPKGRKDQRFASCASARPYRRSPRFVLISLWLT